METFDEVFRPPYANAIIERIISKCLKKPENIMIMDDLEPYFFQRLNLISYIRGSRAQSKL